MHGQGASNVNYSTIVFNFDVLRVSQPVSSTMSRLLEKWITLNPLSPSIHIQILQTNLHTFPERISRENVIIDQGIFSRVIILLILITCLLTVYGYC